MENIDQSLIGKFVIVRANVAGVHAGRVVMSDVSNKTVQLENARRLWRVYTRDKSGSISDVAANGLKPAANHSIGAPIKTVTIVNNNGLEIAEMTDAAWESIATYVSQ